MRVGLVSTAVPLVRGGYRFIVEWLQEKLQERGHAVEVIYLPYTDEPQHILPQMAAFRMIRLENHFDRIITFRPPAHVVQHPRKVVWFIHHLRHFYDLWNTPYSPVANDPQGRALRAAVMSVDNTALTEAYRVFTNSQAVGDRMRRFNGIGSEVLYPPVLRPELFRSGEYGGEIVSVCRLEHHKRQHLLVEAMALTRTPVRLRLSGTSMDPAYVDELRNSVERLGLSDRVTIENRWITEEEKADRLEHALACAYAPFDEDSYGYPTLEAAHAQRCTVTATDSGGVSEFVSGGVTGLVTEPEPGALAQAFDRLHADRGLARRMGQASARRIVELRIDWDTVVERLLA
ncbi:glycosyltransferase family 4 protein [Roseomonas xinghualingensis]|uniref:glycosyltransferase family 4 protein n=1 Tax=Roseomonas xinghualingensis TaxID=2986475 RepID=UPI0021F0F2BF|nr:glycosyltransferase family 4 protein [Roseomonas sp. SXEYE001]MCV4208511.1 glycosyltransferase family 4 protein [Roseomonas sp. SXEYE001]